ncbi:surface antigen variable number repeat-containing protein [Flammeovirgaceae bacterium 311]|nr:surface antigen variable number repeat-containing protein [Flammeovirgaceae bacterium 311]
MLSSFFIYLAEVSVSIAAFALAYHLAFRRLTHFQWNRGYLIGSLLLSTTIPLLPLPAALSSLGLAASPVADTFRLNLEGVGGAAAAGGLLPADGDTTAGTPLPYYSIGLLLLGLYSLGCLYKAGQLMQNLRSIYQLIRNNHQLSREGYTLIHTPENGAPFSFMHYIFLNRNIKALSEEEQAQVLQHEQVHVAQRHTLDLLLFELAGIFFWFHPAVYYLSMQIREVHEYQVDAAVSRSSDVRSYGVLLIKLASQQPALPILNTFSSKQIVNRISMLKQPKSSPVQKFKFLLALPVLALTMLLCAFTGNKDQASTTTFANSTDATAAALAPAEVPIRKITWIGNKAYSTAELNKALGVQKGDLYNKEAFNNRLNYNPDGSDVSSLYMDNGYLFFSVTPKEVFTDNGVELVLTVEEGPQATIGKVTVNGNTKIATDGLLEKINIRPGELFSRSKIIKAQQAIVQTGYFNPETIGINPVPNIEAGTVDIAFSVEEI